MYVFSYKNTYNIVTGNGCDQADCVDDDDDNDSGCYFKLSFFFQFYLFIIFQTLPVCGVCYNNLTDQFRFHRNKGKN